jgi:Sap, sulfolipid-1-addressing protein
MSAQVLPLAITMMAGPQILSAIIFVTGERPTKTSLAFIVAVPIAMSVMILAFMGLAGLFDDSLKDDSGPSTAAKAIQVALVGLLIAAAVKSYLGRETVEPPKWLGGLQHATTRRAFTLGLLLLSIFPSDLVINLTTGINLASNDLSFAHALPLIGLTTLIAALPLLSYLLFRKRAEVAMPKVRNWMNANSWVVNIAVYVIFILLILG